MLCVINQYDETEKGHQVRQMFHIYSKAMTVVVCIGSASPDSGPDPACFDLDPSWLGLPRPSKMLLDDCWNNISPSERSRVRVEDYRWAMQDMVPNTLRVLRKCMGRLVTCEGPGFGGVQFDQYFLDIMGRVRQVGGPLEALSPLRCGDELRAMWDWAAWHRSDRDSVDLE